MNPGRDAVPADSAGPVRLLTPKSLARLRLALTIATFAVLAWYLHTRPRPDISGLSLRWGYFAAACACLPPLLGLRALKWRALLRGAAPDVTVGQSLRSYLGAMALGLVTPGRVGEFSRGLYLPQVSARGWRAAGLVLIDNWTDFLAVLAWSCLGWAAVYGPSGLAMGIMLALVFAPVAFWLRMALSLAARLPAAKGIRDSAEKALAAGAGVRGRDWVEAGGLGLVAYGVEWLQAACLLAFLSPAVPHAWELAGMMALITLANSFQVTLAGLGVREGLAMLMLARAGVGPEAAVLASFLQSALVLFLPALAGLLVKPVPDPALPAVGPA